MQIFMAKLQITRGGSGKYRLNEGPCFFIGRNPMSTIRLNDGMVSGFHATIIKNLEDFYLLNHGRHGVHYPIGPNGEMEPENKLPHLFETPLFRLYQSRDASAQIVDDQGRSINESDMAYFVKMISDPKGWEVLTQIGRKLEDNTKFSIAGIYDFLFTNN